MKNFLLLGNKGQVGWEAERSLASLGKVIGVDYPSIDLADGAALTDLVRTIKPVAIVNAAAYTAVDKAESEPDVAFAINGTAPGILAEEAKKIGAILIHYSTDYVFNGETPQPYTEEDVPCPLNVYGNSKLAGEKAIEAIGGSYIILRTSWVYGSRGNNFLLTMLKLATQRPQLSVVDDQIGAPTNSRALADLTALVLGQCLHPNGHMPMQGLYHATSQGHTSWYAFAQAIFTRYAALSAAIDPTIPFAAPMVVPITTNSYPTPAKRPRLSLLNNKKLLKEFGLQLPLWSQSLELCIQDLVQARPLFRSACVAAS